MTEPVASNWMRTLTAVVEVLVGRLIGLAAGAELRVNFAIAEAAKRARGNSYEKSKITSRASELQSDRSGEW